MSDSKWDAFSWDHLIAAVRRGESGASEACRRRITKQDGVEQMKWREAYEAARTTRAAAVKRAKGVR